MPLKRVLLDTDVIILVEVLENKGTTKHRDKGEGKAKFRESIEYTNDIKTNVISTHLGKFSGAKYDTKYSLTFVKGVWLGIPGSGLESQMAPSEKYVLMLKHVKDGYRLQRAEKSEKLEEILRVRMKLDREDQRVAEAQAKITNGIYHYSDAADSQKIRLQDGRRVQIGKRADFKISQKELSTPHDFVLLRLKLDSDKPGNCVLMVQGKAHWLFDHHWASGERPVKGESPKLYCSFKDRKNAEAVAAFFGIAIPATQNQKPGDLKKN
jgi:hypothetical protein